MITVRPARVSERRSVVALGTAAFAPFGDYRSSLTSWTSNPAMQTLVAVGPAGGCLGFAVVALVQAPGGTRAHLLAVGVAEDQRGRGIGGRLLDAALDLARREALPWGAEHLQLEVAADNTAARALFASRGFRVSPVASPAYDGGRAALTLAAPLTR